MPSGLGRSRPSQSPRPGRRANGVAKVCCVGTTIRRDPAPPVVAPGKATRAVCASLPGAELKAELVSVDVGTGPQGEAIGATLTLPAIRRSAGGRGGRAYGGCSWRRFHLGLGAGCGRPRGDRSRGSRYSDGRHVRAQPVSWLQGGGGSASGTQRREGILRAQGIGSRGWACRSPGMGASPTQCGARCKDEGSEGRY
jgi:hypothetical protein